MKPSSTHADAPHLQVAASDIAAIHDRGLSLARERQYDEAIKLLLIVTEADKGQIEALRHLAQAYSDGGHWIESEVAWLRYLERCPKAADAYKHLGNLRKRMGKLDLAVESLKRAVSLDGLSVILQVDLGIAFAQANRYPEAKLAFERAIQIEPAHFDAHLNLGILLQQMQKSDEAIVQLRKTIELRPSDPSGHNNLGVALSDRGDFDAAIACYDKLLAEHPTYYLAWNNLGNALRSVGRTDDALAALERAIELKPDYIEAYNNRGIVYCQACDFGKAAESYNRALLLRPDYPEAHANRGLVYLLLGNFQQGWADYEWRWQGGHGLQRRHFLGKVWDGSPLAGKRILLYYEQGLGDTFQFIRYAKELKTRGATVIFECQPIMRQILSQTPGIDEFFIRGEKPPLCDFYAPLLSLPGLCQTNLDNLPRRVPYVFADPAMVWEWKRRLSHIDGFRIGIVWQGNPQHKGDRTRSIALKYFSPLAEVPGVKLVTLQRNFGVEQIEKLDRLFELTDLKGIAEQSDGWQRTASILSNLDLVISADTSVAHLAGAMGIPVWIAIPPSPDWRWLLDREDTPWYPTMRVFRQRTEGDWEETFGRIAEALRARLAMSDKTLQKPASDVDQQESQSLLRRSADHVHKNEPAIAQELLERAVRLDPMNANAHQDLGVTYAKQRRLHEALACFRRALELAPDSPGLYANLGLACLHMGQVEEAISHLRKGIWLGAGSADAHKNLARALMALPDPAAAEESYWAALRLQPDDAEAHYSLSQALLMQGKFEQGWLEYEWRWRWQNTPRRNLDRPRWSGQSLEGKRIVLLAEQDVRYTVQMARYTHVLAQRGARVVLECQPELVKLMAGCLSVERVVPAGSRLPEHDFHTALLSLPSTLGTTLQTIPADRPYLGVDTEIAKLWQQRFSGIKGLKIGVATDSTGIGYPSQSNYLTERIIQRLSSPERHTLIEVQCAHSSLGHDGIQKTHAAGSVSLSALGEIPIDTADKYATLAAAIRSFDLLLTADNVMAHIAGAIGVATWLILPVVADPQWLVNQDRSFWYPTLRIFRQRRRGEWNELVTVLGAALQEIARPGDSRM